MSSRVAKKKKSRVYYFSLLVMFCIVSSTCVETFPVVEESSLSVSLYLLIGGDSSVGFLHGEVW